MKIAIVYGGTRAHGNTEMLTEQAVKDLHVDRIFLKEYRIQPIEDLRHTEEGFHDIDDDYNSVIDRVLEADVLVFATPIYWYGMSGFMKNFVDRWSQTLRDSNRPRFREQMKGKTGYVIAVGGDQPLLKGLPLVLQFQHIFEFFGTQYGGYVLGEGNRPGAILEDREAMRKAELLNAVLKERV
ncbi:multimeric flavodoxin WrbA [Paenibacillus phyllosphaerae]|uniref:Multimeric flavodoxin WrbA n=1 Tax=Paenibacillus phyllosphaerae TaxID=274593 RepID=A0A7W5B3Y9_9BACL|nr:flavodoxin family protein [Paenibacillus phyllosphaerae]MBB3113973.1 multimeric flavodoxin WrbA [Paenibacillus phyllosphaerae]